MSWTIDQLQALEDAIALGVLRVRHGDRDQTFQSMDDMLRLRDLMRRELGLLGPDGGLTHRYCSFSKGLS